MDLPQKAVHNILSIKSICLLLLLNLCILTTAEGADFSGDGKITLRQTQGNGFGYRQGYTTLEGFLIHNPFDESISPFIDVRAHHLNNGNWAGKFGLGLRKYDCSSNGIWGGNVYYDYRNTRHKKFQQIGLGMEFLHCCFDARLNVYLPVGGLKSRYYDCKTTTFCDSPFGFGINGNMVNNTLIQDNIINTPADLRALT